MASALIPFTPMADFHPYTWLMWLAASMAVALLTRNPFYLTITLLAAALVYAVLLRRGLAHGLVGAAHSRPRTWLPVLKLALLLWAFATVFNAFTVHLGQHVLFVLPRSWPLIGGPITLEAVIYGFVTGLSFVTLILVFTVFNSAVGPQTLLRMTPAFAHHAAVALTIALSFIPQTVAAWQEIREAQRLRGYRVRRLRDLQPLFVSLLAIGLDRAIQLAESMDARGFGGNVAALDRRERWLAGAGSVAGLLLLLAALLARAFGPGNRVDLALLAAGALLLGWVLWRQGQRVQRTRYRRWRWRPRDSVVAGLTGVLLASVLALSLFFGEQFFYYPYPPYPLLPAFDPLLGLLATLLVAPALLMPVVSSEQYAVTSNQYSVDGVQ